MSRNELDCSIDALGGLEGHAHQSVLSDINFLIYPNSEKILGLR